MRDTKEILAAIKMVELGIAPFEGPSFFSKEEITNALESLSPEDRRKAKRKFRKLHKKAYKKLGIRCMSNMQPSAAELRRRRAAVHRMILSDLSD